jgi:hypothetical protein
VTEPHVGWYSKDQIAQAVLDTELDTTPTNAVVIDAVETFRRPVDHREMHDVYIVISEGAVERRQSVLVAGVHRRLRLADSQRHHHLGARRAVPGERGDRMNRTLKTALVSGAAALAVAGAVGVAAPANATVYYADVITVVSWVGGDSWLEVDYPGEGVVMEESPSKTATDHWSAVSGARIGADPIMGDADWICARFVNGRLVASDSAYAGDGHDANCTGYLR